MAAENQPEDQPSQDLLAERRKGVLWLTLNRPAKLNALSEPMVTGLLDELARAAKDSEVGAVVVTGAGRGFCSGGDIGAMRSRNDGPAASVEERAAALRRSEEVVLLLHEIPKVTIAAVNGPVAGAGLGIALGCDLRIASDNARFGTAFARVGFSGDFGGSWLLSKLVGPAKARELYFLADVVGADEALRLGIVNRVVPAESLADEAATLAGQIANGPRVAYAYMKANLNLADICDLRTMLDRESLTQTLAGRTEDHREAVNAFLEKREPRFTGR
jgi:2-(1,2-epoxy-1,2-dihydrophenyl)acetyl-CoA isomerase